MPLKEVAALARSERALVTASENWNEVLGRNDYKKY